MGGWEFPDPIDSGQAALGPPFLPNEPKLGAAGKFASEIRPSFAKTGSFRAGISHAFHRSRVAKVPTDDHFVVHSSSFKPKAAGILRISKEVIWGTF